MVHDQLLRLGLHPERTENMFKSSFTLQSVFLPADSLVERIFVSFCGAGSIVFLFNKTVSKITLGTGETGTPL